MMKPQSYLDFEAAPQDGEPGYAVLAKAIHVLHGFFAKSDGKYAIAFPNARFGEGYRSTGQSVRVFASSTDDLYDLVKAVGGHNLMRDYMRISIPRDVPADFRGQWRAWVRVRVQSAEGINRGKTIARAHASPVFEMRSSSGHQYVLRFVSIPGAKQVDDCQPNSYGLAVTGNRAGVGRNMFFLPEI